MLPEHERGWQGEAAEDGGLLFTRVLRGVGERRVLDGPLIRSSEARRLDAMAAELQETYALHGRLVSKDRDIRITGPSRAWPMRSSRWGRRASPSSGTRGLAR